MLRDEKTRKRGTIHGRAKIGWIYNSNPQYAIMTNDDNLIFIYTKLRQIKPFFDVLLTMNLSIILAINQLNAQILLL